MTRVESIEQLTAEAFSEILKENWSEAVPKIGYLSAAKVDQGVLSDVYRVHLDYATCGKPENNRKKDASSSIAKATPRDALRSTESMPPADWLVKFCRSDLDLSWMIRNETIFYSRIVPEILAPASNSSGGNGQLSLSRTSLPFAIPTFLSGSDRHLIIQEITNVKTYPLTEGCPPDKIDFLLKSLAAWHAACWESTPVLKQLDLGNPAEIHAEGERLVFPAGMGQRLPPLQKEGLFISSWEETVDHMIQEDGQREEKLLDTELMDYITKLCQKLCTLRLRDIHEKVHNHLVTCVHGDYHISNWLFPTNEDQDKKPVLVDFATAGYGNPLVDLVFFIVVSTNDEVVSNSQLCLEKYYQLLIECDPNLSPKVSLATLQEWFPWAILCQFMILVAYDGICRNIAKAEPDEQKRENQTRHFCNVNRRMILAIRSIENWDAILSELGTTSCEDRKEAQKFCETTALEI